MSIEIHYTKNMPSIDTKSNDQTADNIVLIGMPGAGKSTLGVVLAKIINYDFVDADLLIQKQYNKTLERIIEELGSDGFIEAESSVLSNLSLKHTVLATGGSAVYSDDAMCHLSELGRIVYLKISYDELCKRLVDLIERGVVMRSCDTVSLCDLYDEREPLYKRYADITVEIDGLTITEAARKIAAILD